MQVLMGVEGLEDVEKVLQEFASRGGHLKPLLKRVGKILLGGVTKNFEEQGRPQRWKPRSELTNKIYSNQALTSYSSSTANRQFVRLETYRRNSARAVERRMGSLILSGRGDLKNSIVDKVDGDSVKVGSPLPYARIHQLGGVITPKSAKCLMIPMGNGGMLQLKKVTMPARPYLLATNEEKPQIINVSKLYILEGRVQ